VAVAIRVEAPAASIGGGGSIVDVLPVCEVRRMADGGGRRCGV
jgi:hypothetical protein